MRLKTKTEEEIEMKKTYFSPQMQMDIVSDRDMISTSLGMQANGTDWIIDWSNRDSGAGEL